MTLLSVNIRCFGAERTKYETMKCSSWHSLAVFLSVMLPGALFASGEQDVSNRLKEEVVALRATVENLRAEVATLRRSVLAVQLERHRENIREIKAELDRVRIEQAELAELDRGRQHDIRELEELLAGGEFAPDSRAQIESARIDLTLGRVQKTTRQTEATLVRETELLRRLKTEEESVKQLNEASKLTKGAMQ